MKKIGSTQILPSVLLFAISLSMACGRSEMSAGPDEEPFGAGGTGGRNATSSEDPGAGGQSGGATSAGPGGAWAGGGSKSNVSVSGGAVASSTSASKPLGGSGGSSGGGGTSTMSTSSTKPVGGAGAIGGSSGGSGGVSALAGSKASGGSSTTGGTSGVVKCTNATPCGGDVVGTWDVTSSCLTVSGQMDLSMLGLSCRSAGVEGNLQVSGAWNAVANGTYVDKTTTTGRLQIAMPASCLRISGTTVGCDSLSMFLSILGLSGSSCTESTAGGCNCAASVKQMGSMGTVSLSPSTSGTYRVSGNAIVLDDDTRYTYCVSGSQLNMAPRGGNPPTTGSIVFQKR